MRNSLCKRQALALLSPVQAKTNPELRRQLIRRRGLRKVRDLRLGSALARATGKSESYTSRQVAGAAPLPEIDRREWARRLASEGCRAEAVGLYAHECDGVLIPLPSLERLQSTEVEVAEANEATGKVIGLVLRCGRSAEDLLNVADAIDEAVRELVEAKAAITRDLDLELAG